MLHPYVKIQLSELREWERRTGNKEHQFIMSVVVFV